MSQPNVRVRRTRALLRQALVELIEDRGFDHVTVGVMERKRWPVAKVAFRPADFIARTFQRGYASVERLRAPCAKCHVAHSICGRSG